MSEATGIVNAFGDRVVNRLPAEIRDNLTDETREALRHAAAETRATDWSQVHGIDVRYSLPLPGGRYYLRILAGPERRPVVRVLKDRRHNRLRTFVNILMIGVAAAVFYTLAAAVLLLMSSAIG